jgi:hypothetical protein
MARGRAKLSDKQERILVQAQLMGLTPRDMQQISNRLIALQREADEIKKVGDAIQGYSWTKTEKGTWNITTPDGYLCEFSKGQRVKRDYWSRKLDYSIKVTKPGTAFKPRHLQKKGIGVNDDWTARICPEGSKELYALINWAHGLKWEIKNQ